MNNILLKKKISECHNGMVVAFEQGDNVFIARIDDVDGHFQRALGIYYTGNEPSPNYFILKEDSLIGMNLPENGGIYGLRKATDDEVDLLFKKAEEYSVTCVNDLSAGRVASITYGEDGKCRIQRRKNGRYNIIFGELSGNDGEVLVNVPIVRALNGKEITSIKLVGEMERLAFNGRLRKHCEKNNGIVVNRIKKQLYDSVCDMDVESLADILPYHAANEYDYSIDSIVVKLSELRTYINSQINSFAELDSLHDFNARLRDGFATVAAHAIAGMQAAEIKVRNS